MPILLIYGAPRRKRPIMLRPPSGLSPIRTLAGNGVGGSRGGGVNSGAMGNTSRLPGPFAGPDQRGARFAAV